MVEGHCSESLALTQLIVLYHVIQRHAESGTHREAALVTTEATVPDLLSRQGLPTLAAP
jgi:hypothetical protein